VRKYFGLRADILVDNFVFFQDGLEVPVTAVFIIPCGKY
jgi:hypothetical protein